MKQTDLPAKSFKQWKSVKVLENNSSTLNRHLSGGTLKYSAPEQ